MVKVLGLNGDQVAAYAAKQCNVDVVSAYPITPQTIIVEEYSNFVANGEVDTEFICVESEHSAMSACIGSSITGARVFTATSSQGLALMHEMLYIASGLRCPIVMCVVNRALSSPINIHCDHSDMMGSRDCGWIQIFAENAQEAYDWIIQAFKIAEDHNILLPIAINIDAFMISHALENVSVLDDETVTKFLPDRNPKNTLNPDNPALIGSFALHNYFFEFKAQQDDAMNKVHGKIIEITEEYTKISQRQCKPISTFNTDNAETAVVSMGSTSGMLRMVAKQLRNEGMKVGTIKISSYRPFPEDDFLKAIKNVSSLVILDRALSLGAPMGPLCSDITSTIYEAEEDVKIKNVIYGLGGRDLSPTDANLIFKKGLALSEGKEVKKRIELIGVRE
jgi:pyruvate ferredoxin oxidoreductase alpha subunit